MEREFSFDRKFWTHDGHEVFEPLDVTMTIPDEISKYLEGFEGYLDRVIDDLKDYFRHTRFHKEPSSESEELRKIEFVAYSIYRDPSNPCLTEEFDFSCEIEPKYEPRFIEDLPNRGVGWKNTLSTIEFYSSDPIIGFVSDAYHYLY